MTRAERDGNVGAGCGRLDRRLVHEQLRQAATDLATAQLLERRADRSASPAMAELLRERALVRRRRAERLRWAADVPRPRAGPRT
jgi:hypothetical protein